LVTFYDCVVAGGGPAGAFAAREMTRAGRKVLIVDPATGRPRLEGLSERVAQLLRSRGLEDALATASAPAPRSVDWAGLKRSANGERLVRRPAFDAALRRAAVDAGAELIRARVGRIGKADPEQGVTLKLSTGETVAARLMIDARGRQAPSSRRLKGPQTLSISGHVEAAPVSARTHVAAAPEGWLWLAEVPGFGRWLQISVAAGSLAGTGEAALRDRVTRFLSQPGIGDLAGPLGFRSPLLARNAGLVLSAPELKLPVIPVGDAAVAIDPLSGHGLFWALSSALAAVPMALTVLENPVQGAELAARFYRDRVVETFWRQARVARDFYRLERGYADEPFWAGRAVWPDDEPVHAVPQSAALERRVVVENNRLAERDVLITLQDPGGVAFVAGLPVGDLAGFIGMGPAATPLPDNPSPALQAALQWLESRGLFSGRQSRLPHQPTRTRETA